MGEDSKHPTATPDTQGAKRGIGQLALVGVIAGVTFFVLFCCCSLSATPFGQAFWSGFFSGLSSQMAEDFQNIFGPLLRLFGA